MRENRINYQSFLKDTLDAQKRTVKRIAVDWMGAAILFLFLDIVVLIIALTLYDKEHANRILYIAIPILSVICAIFGFVSVSRISIVNKLNHLNIDEDEKINVECHKVRFIIHPIGRWNFNAIWEMVLIANNRQKYVYILPKMILNSKIVREDVRRKCEGKTVETLCYKGSGLIKFFDTFGADEE